jgi:CheY-like chemotaxis protein
MSCVTVWCMHTLVLSTDDAADRDHPRVRAPAVHPDRPAHAHYPAPEPCVSSLRLSPPFALLTMACTVKWCLDNSISAEVTTPVSPPDLASALICALESSTVSPVATAKEGTLEILLAEDNVVNQKLAVKILEKYGHSVAIAENGAFAVEKFKGGIESRHPFDIILMDVSMPFMGGMEATQLIRKHEADYKLRRTPIIALTAHAMIGDRERCLAVGMDDHITSESREPTSVLQVSEASLSLQSPCARQTSWHQSTGSRTARGRACCATRWACTTASSTHNHLRLPSVIPPHRLQEDTAVHPGAIYLISLIYACRVLHPLRVFLRSLARVFDSKP